MSLLGRETVDSRVDDFVTEFLRHNLLKPPLIIFAQIEQMGALLFWAQRLGVTLFVSACTSDCNGAVCALGTVPLEKIGPAT
jgi:hypothetical protein